MKGDFSRAMVLYREAIAIDASFPLGYYNLANIQKKTGQIDEAIDNLKKAVELKPDWEQALNNLAGTLLYAGYNDEAILYYQRMVELNPDVVDAELKLAAAYTAAGRFDEGVALYQSMLQRSPADTQLLELLGKLLYTAHRYQDLLGYCAHVKQYFPDDPKPYATEAMAYARMGEWQTAQKILDELLVKYAPTYHMVMAYASIARAAGVNSKVIKLTRKLLQTQGELLTPDELAELHFNLGRLYDHESGFDQAFFHFRKANSYKFQGFDVGELQQFISHTTDILTRDFFERTAKPSGTAARPVFILGMPRSGTSLVEQILDCHSQVFGAGELYYINQIAQQVAGPDGVYGVSVAGMDGDEIERYAGQYLKKIDELNSTARYVTDKMPQNFLHLGLIARLFPDARIIHCVRDPVDVCLSCYFQSFNQGHDYSYDLEAVASYYRSYHDLMQHWKRSLKLPFFTLQYEGFIEQQEQTTAALLTFLDLPWEDGCMKHYENPRLTVTSSHDQVRQPIYKRSVQRWRHYERHIGPLIEQLQGL